MDIRQVVTDKIIHLLETDGGKKMKRWINQNASGFPTNGVTGKGYRGINVLLLWAEAAERGYTSNVWMTYKQAAGLGAQVRKGEKSVTCVYFEKVARKDKDGEEQPQEEGKKTFFPMCKPFWLFNVEQIDGLPADFDKTAQVQEGGSAFIALEAAERLIQASGADIRHGGNRACYFPSMDFINLPLREQFTSPATYYATAVHELTHWTGHESRLKREFGRRFGSEAYAFEELVAELGSAFLAGHIGFIDETVEGHADYLANWLTVLKNDKTAIFTAAKHANAAADFIMGFDSAEASE